MGECSSCNITSCGLLCQRHIGHTIYEMLKNIDTCESHIGEFAEVYKSDDKGLRKFEQRYDNSGNISFKLNKNNMTIGLNKVFSTSEYNIYESLEDYCKYIGLSKEDTDDLVEKLRELNSKKRLFVPFKHNTVFSIDSTLDGVPYRTKRNELSSHNWYIDDKYDVHCKVTILNTLGRYMTFDVEEYNRSFSILAIDMDTRLQNDEIIQFNKIGIVRPIEFISNNTKYAVDNVYIYKYNMNSCYVIGYWNNGNIQYLNLVETLSEDVTKYMKIIAWHRRLMAPYYLIEPVVYNMDKGVIE